jgi:hypothetical protein
VKKPVKAVVPARPVPKAAQPGNRPGQGKAAHVKPAAKKVPPKKVTPAVKAARHAAAVKAAKTRAANLKKAKAHPRRQLALGEGVACCAAEALAASLRLSGFSVTDADVLALYWRTAGDPDEGATIWATLEAAARYGVAGYAVASFRPAGLEEVMPHGTPDSTSAELRLPGVHGTRVNRAGLILGLDLPGPHAVLDTGSEWITWGETWPAWAFPGAAIEEAWTVKWELAQHLRDEVLGHRDRHVRPARRILAALAVLHVAAVNGGHDLAEPFAVGSLTS